MYHPNTNRFVVAADVDVVVLGVIVVVVVIVE